MGGGIERVFGAFASLSAESRSRHSAEIFVGSLFTRPRWQVKEKTKGGYVRAGGGAAAAPAAAEDKKGGKRQAAAPAEPDVAEAAAPEDKKGGKRKAAAALILSSRAWITITSLPLLGRSSQNFLNSGNSSPFGSAVRMDRPRAERP